MKISHRIALALVITAGLAISTPADAGKKDKGDEVSEAAAAQYKAIQDGRIAEFQDVWNKAKAIQTNLTEQEAGITKIHTDFKTTVGVAQDAPLQTAFDDLKTKAEGKLKVALNGKTPKLEASDAVPENVQKAIDAVNGAVTEFQAIVDRAEALKPQVTELIDASKAFPTQLTPDLLTKNGLTAKDLGAEKKVVGNNVDAIKETPDRIQGIINSAATFFSSVQALGPQ